MAASAGRGASGIFRQIADNAGLDDQTTAHILRHTFATTLIRGGTDLVIVAELVGHSRLDTVRVYTPTHSPRPRPSTRTATHRPLTEHVTAPAHLRDQRRLMAPFERIPVAPPYISRYLDPALPVVDVGSGNGRYTRWLASRFPAAVGVDVASAAVTRARDESDGTANAHGARRTDPRLPSGARREGSPLTRHPTQATRHPTCGNCLPGGTGRAGRGPLQLCWLPVIGHLRAASGASHAGLSATPAPDC